MLAAAAQQQILLTVCSLKTPQFHFGKFLTAVRVPVAVQPRQTRRLLKRSFSFRLRPRVGPAASIRAALAMTAA